MRFVIPWTIFVALCLLEKLVEARNPNVIVFMADDLGYGDLASYGNTIQESNPIETMASEGLKFTQWTSPAFICTPSRAAFLTGRYARRSGIYGNSSLVFAPRASGGLPSSEITLAEAMKAQGYVTGMVGKWHLGINQARQGDGVHLPHNHGFDWVGTNLPLSQSGNCVETNSVAEQQKTCFIYNGSNIVQQPIRLATLTEKLLEDALTFIDANQDKEFFFYLAFPQVHQALFCNDDFCGKSARGKYGDNINEMAWVVGEVLKKLKNLNIDKETLAIFSSDHGAPTPNCRSPQTNGVFRGGKGSTWEGGHRVPGIAWWPGTIPANTISHNLVNHMDVFNTAIHLAGGANFLATLKSSTVIDGQLIPDIVSGNPVRDTLFYYCSDRLMAVRYGNFKVHYRTMGPLAKSGSCKAGIYDTACYTGADIHELGTPAVFDLTTADGESEKEALDENLSTTKDILSDVDALVTAHEATFVSVANSQLDLPGSSRLIPCCNAPLCTCNYL